MAQKRKIPSEESNPQNGECKKSRDNSRDKSPSSDRELRNKYERDRREKRSEEEKRKCREARNRKRKSRANLPSAPSLAIAPEFSVLPATFSQNCEFHFKPDGRDHQCLAMSISFLTRAHRNDLESWTTQTMDEIVLAGDVLYHRIRLNFRTFQGHLIPPIFYGDLSVEHLALVSPADYSVWGELIQLSFSTNYFVCGNLDDSFVDESYSVTLDHGITSLFSTKYASGIIIANLKTFGLLKKNGRMYFFDSHSCRADTGEIDDFAQGPSVLISSSNYGLCMERVRLTLGFQSVQYEIYAIAAHSLSE